MNRSSTSSSDSWKTSLAVALGVLLLLELVVRLPTVEAWLGRPDVHYHPGVAERIEALETTQRDDSVDVLFVGSSVVRTNIRPLLFDQLVSEAGVRLTSFNGGLSALTVDPARLYVENLWLQEAEPLMVVQAVRYADIVDAVPAAEFEPFTTSRIEPLWIEDSAVSRVEEFFLLRSHLLQRAGLLTELLADPPEAFRSRVGAPIDERGWTATTVTLAERRATTTLTDILGGAEGAVGYNHPLSGEALEDGLASLDATIEQVLSSGSTYVLVNMPEHGDKFLNAEDGGTRYQAYLDALRALADKHRVAFIDVTAADAEMFRDDLWFSDFHHMSPVGADRFTRLLASAMIEGGLLPVSGS